MTSYANRNHAPVAANFIVVSASCSTQASAQAAGIGPFRGLFAITSCSFTITGHNQQTLAIDNMAKNSTIWIEGSFISVIATATSLYALI